MALANIKANDTGDFGRVKNNPPKVVTGTSSASTGANVSTDVVELPTGGSMTQNGGAVNPVNDAIDRIQNFFGFLTPLKDNIYQNTTPSDKTKDQINYVLTPKTKNYGLSAVGNGDEEHPVKVTDEVGAKSFPLWILAVVPILYLLFRK